MEKQVRNMYTHTEMNIKDVKFKENKSLTHIFLPGEIKNPVQKMSKLQHLDI